LHDTGVNDRYPDKTGGVGGEKLRGKIVRAFDHEIVAFCEL